MAKRKIIGKQASSEGVDMSPKKEEAAFPGDHSIVFNDGRITRAKGKGREHNPFSLGSKEYAEWLRGWKAGD